ncbi:MAG: flavin reductase [Thermoplasmata archaeon]
MTPDSLRQAYRQFTTGVSLITTHGTAGPNVTAAEWTFNVSYEPFLISVHIGRGKATHDAIEQTGEFGVNIVAEDQVAAMALAGHFSKRVVDKLSSDLFDTYPAKRIKAPLIRGCLLNAECRVVQQVAMGDHTAFVGEVVEFTVDGSRNPVILHKGARRLGARIRRRADVTVAVTPMQAARGAGITATGELMAPSRAFKKIHIRLIDPKGIEIVEREALTGAEGYFSADLAIPAEAPSGVYVILARYRDAEGSARLRVT